MTNTTAITNEDLTRIQAVADAIYRSALARFLHNVSPDETTDIVVGVSRATSYAYDATCAQVSGMDSNSAGPVEVRTVHPDAVKRTGRTHNLSVRSPMTFWFPDGSGFEVDFETVYGTVKPILGRGGIVWDRPKHADQLVKVRRFESGYLD